MRNNKAKPESTGAKGYLRAVAFSCGIGLVVTVVFLLLFALLLSVKDLPHGAIEPMALFAASAGALAAGFCCARIRREQGLLLGVGCGTVLFLVLVLSSFTISDDGFGMAALLKWVIMALCGAIGGVTGVNVRTRRK